MTPEVLHILTQASYGCKNALDIMGFFSSVLFDILFDILEK